MVRWQQVLQTQREQGALPTSFANNMAHNDNASGVTGGIVV